MKLISLIAPLLISSTLFANSNLINLMQRAEQGDQQAQFQLSVLYRNGQAMPKDLKKAFDWGLKSAKQGHREAQFNLGISYFKGKVMAKNDKLAYKWVIRSARQGFPQAQVVTALNYCLGTGTAKNISKCAYWARKARGNGKNIDKLWKHFELWKY